MNIKEYISSGMVELYVLGLATEQERMEFERLCAQYPELIEARNNFELAIEKQAMDNAVAPPTGCKEEIWSALKHTPASNTPKIITMEPTSRRSSGARWLAAASIVLLIGAGYFAYDFYKKNEESKLAIKELEKKLNQADSAANAQKEMVDPAITLVTMKPLKPGMPSANIYWDSTSTNVFLVIKNMPKLANEQQYQLWALIDGKDPTSLGMFDGSDEKVILRMDKTQKANAFAISIEKRGNTGGPNTDQIQNMGNVPKKDL